MRLKLKSMKIENFKGIKDLAVTFNDGKTIIKGRNGSGKSSIVDAFTWCLFNRDSHGNAPGSDNFREKPLDENGNEIHGLDTTVELRMELDGKMFNVKRTQKENWTKKRGNAEAVFSGNNSAYWINDVETKQSEFKERIAEIANEDLFRILGTLGEFNRLDWKKRRAMLISLSDKDIDGELLNEPTYAAIKAETEQRAVSVDELRKIMQDRKRSINDELKAFPIRIDEQVKSVASLDQTIISDSEYIVKDTEETIANIDRQIAEALAGNQAEADRAKLEALTREAFSLKQIISQEFNSKKNDLENRLGDCKAQVKRKEDERQRLESKARDLITYKTAEESKREGLRTAYKAKYSEQFDAVIEDVCPTCKRPLEAEAVEAARNDALKRFNELKKAELDDIKQRGQMVARRIEDLEKDIESTETALRDITGELRKLSDEQDSTLSQLMMMPQVPDYTADPKIQEIEDQINAIRAKGVKADPMEHVMKLRKRKEELQQKVREHREILARAEAAKASQARVEELRRMQKEAGQRMLETEHMIDLLDSYTQDRCAALENSINSKFPGIRWKLFDVQINGGINDCCMCMVPCESGLVAYNSANTASQINADIGIINALSDHYGVKVPLFVDNGERTTSFASTDTQLITLSVSPCELMIKGSDIENAA